MVPLSLSVGHGHGSSVRKRSDSRFLLFSHLLTRHGQNARYSDEHEFVERMFSLFDFNGEYMQ